MTDWDEPARRHVVRPPALVLIMSASFFWPGLAAFKAPDAGQGASATAQQEYGVLFDRLYPIAAKKSASFFVLLNGTSKYRSRRFFSCGPALERQRQ